MRLRDTEGSALRADRSHVAQTKEAMLCVHSILPFYRSTVGFDRMFSMLDELGGVDGSAPSYPPYNIERSGENAFASRSRSPGSLTPIFDRSEGNTLTIRGENRPTTRKTGDVLYKGIAERAFERSFQLADHVVVKDARLENGLLHVDLVREIPEAMKPRAILIASSARFWRSSRPGRRLTFRPIEIWRAPAFRAHPARCARGRARRNSRRPRSSRRVLRS
jgi:molecular chaperone IbpA